MLDGYYYCLNCHSEITPDYNEHCCFCGSAAVAVSGDYSPEEVETAFDLLNKHQQGLVIVPPCKVGDTVYIIFHQKVIQGTVRLIRPFISKEEIVFKGNIVCEIDSFFIEGKKEQQEFYVVFVNPYGIERIAYLTREKAEQALEVLKVGAGNG